GRASPIEAMRPELFAPAGIDHQFNFIANRLPRRSDEQFIKLPIAAAERTPAHLDRLEAAAHDISQQLPERVGLVEENRTVGFDAVAIVPAEQPRDWLPARFAEDVPQGEVEAADRVLYRAAASLPERGLTELLGDPLGLQCRFAFEQRPQEPHRTFDERAGS